MIFQPEQNTFNFRNRNNMSEYNYLALLDDVLKTGDKKSIYGHDDKYLLSKFGAMLKFDCTDGKVPILTTKRVAWKNALKEILWMIEGSNNVVELTKQGCHIWDDWAVKFLNQNNHYFKDNPLVLDSYRDLVEKESIIVATIPLHYSNSTKWEYYVESHKGSGHPVKWGKLDQTKWVIDNIQKTPDRKSFVVTYWNPTHVYQMADECNEPSVVLPACHFSYTVQQSNGFLNLSLKIRSWDLFLGAPFNIAQYGMLLHMYAKCTGFKPGTLVVMADDHHIYSDQIEQVLKQLERTPTEFPTLSIVDRNQQYLQDFEFSDFIVENYNPQETIKAPVTVVGGYK